MPCCLRLLAIKVAPSTSLMLFLLLDRADADRRARCRQGPGPKKSPSADYAFMAMAEKGLSDAGLLFRCSRGRRDQWTGWKPRSKARSTNHNPATVAIAPEPPTSTTLR